MNSADAASRESHGAERAVAFVGLTKRYADVLALDHVDLAIDEGEFVTVLGPSGCGKSTLLRVVSGFQEPSEGDVLLHGRTVVGVPPYRRNTSMVFQDYALFPHRTVAQNIGFGLRMRKVDADEIKRRVGEMLDLLGLSGLGDRRIGQISGGQAQRVALGRSLIVEPAVLLLDEPLGALDLKLRKQMQVELKRIQRQVGITFIYVTHDQEEALTMSDRIAVLNQGRLMQYGTPLDVYRHPTHRFVADFIGETNLIPCRIEGRYGDQTAVVGARSGERYMVSSARGLAQGGTVTLVVRPEMMRFVTPETAPVNVVDVTVRETIFVGPSVRVSGASDGGLDLVAVLRPGDRVPARGERAALTWAPEDAILVASD